MHLHLRLLPVLKRPSSTAPPADDAKLPTLCKADGSDPEPGSEAAREGPYWSLMFEASVCAIEACMLLTL